MDIKGEIEKHKKSLLDARDVIDNLSMQVNQAQQSLQNAQQEAFRIQSILNYLIGVDSAKNNADISK